LTRRCSLGDLGGWVVGVFEHIGDMSVYQLVLALALKIPSRRSSA
jgi:hypothetical protein